MDDATTFCLESPAFPDGGAIPKRYARDGENVSPPLAWKDPPAGTRSYALILEDPDAPGGTFRHWALYDIAADRMLLPEGPDTGVKIEELGYGVNDFGNPTYDGPQPHKQDAAHHYCFRLVALDIDKLDLPARASVGDVWDVARTHLLAEAALTGLYRAD